MNQPQMNPMYMNPMLINPIGMNPMGINPMEINNQQNNFNQIGMDQTAIEVKNIVQPYEIKIKELEEIIRQKDLEIAILKQKLNKSSSNNNFININPMIMGQNMNPMMMQGFSLQNLQFLKDKAEKLHILLKTENGDFSNECSRQDKVSILYEKNNINRGYLIHKYKVLLPDFTFRENGINKNYSLIYLKNDCIDIIFKDVDCNTIVLNLSQDCQIQLALIYYLIKSDNVDYLPQILKGNFNAIKFIYNSNQLNFNDTRTVSNVFQNGSKVAVLYSGSK